MTKEASSLAQDFTKALNLTLRPRRVIVLALGLLIGVAVAILFFWLGGLIKPGGLRWLSWIIQRIGALVFAYVALSSLCSVVAMAHAESSDEKIGVPMGWALIARNLSPIVLATMKPIIVFLALIAIIWLGGALGAIPEVGPIVWSIISIVPLAAGLVMIFIVVKLFLVSFLLPAALSVNKEKGVASYKECVRLLKGHAAHILGRVGVAVLVCLIFYRILLAGFSFTATHSSRTMGKNRATLRGSPLLEYVAGIPGTAGTAPRRFGVENPASPFQEASLTAVEREFRGVAPVLRLMPGTAVEGGFRMKATQKVGGWIFSIILIVASSIIFSLPFLFFAMSGYCAYQSFKEAPELPLRTEAVDWSEIKETAQEIAGKRKGTAGEKPKKDSPA
jgi:hypothetical protein